MLWGAFDQYMAVGKGSVRPKAVNDRKINLRWFLLDDAHVEDAEWLALVELRRTRFDHSPDCQKTGVDHYSWVRGGSFRLLPSSQAGVLVYVEEAKGHCLLRVLG